MVSIKYAVHIPQIGWRAGWAENGAALGTTGFGIPLECIKFLIDGLPEGTAIQFRAHVESLGWMDWGGLGMEIGTRNVGKRLQGIHVRWLSNPGGCVLLGRAHISGYGWQPFEDIERRLIGYPNSGKQIEAVQFFIAERSTKELHQVRRNPSEAFAKTADTAKTLAEAVTAIIGMDSALDATILACATPIPFTCEVAGILFIISVVQGIKVGDKLFETDHAGNVRMVDRGGASGNQLESHSGGSKEANAGSQNGAGGEKKGGSDLKPKDGTKPHDGGGIKLT